MNSVPLGLVLYGMRGGHSCFYCSRGRVFASPLCLSQGSEPSSMPGSLHQIYLPSSNHPEKIMTCSISPRGSQSAPLCSHRIAPCPRVLCPPKLTPVSVCMSSLSPEGPGCTGGNTRHPWLPTISLFFPHSY